MGFFSWKTQDTKMSIANAYSRRKPFTVYMIDDKGNKWKEDDYHGYGVFGGKDYYELLAEINGSEPNRDIGITLAFKEKAPCKFPNLVEDPNWTWVDSEPEHCPDQGYFY